MLPHAASLRLLVVAYGDAICSILPRLLRIMHKEMHEACLTAFC